MTQQRASRMGVEKVPEEAIERDVSDLDEGLSSEEERDEARDEMLHGFRKVCGRSAYWIFIVFSIFGVVLIAAKLFSEKGLDNIEFAASMGFLGAVLAIVAGTAKGLFGGEG